MPVQADLNDSSRVPPRRHKTDQVYKDKGRKLLNRAMRKYPDAEDPVDAFVRLCGDPEWVLRASTARTYKAYIIKCLEIEVAEGRCDPARAIEGIEQIAGLLTQRRGKPKARTSRLKCLDVTEEEVQLVVDDLTDRMKAGLTDLADVALVGYVVLDPHFGLRPCEWQHARIIASALVVTNAKFAVYRGAGPSRRISLEGAPGRLSLAAPVLIQALQTLIKMHGSWERVHAILAERLARICHRLGLVRISLYSLRHAAIATWKRAGLDRIEIAALAGHISAKTASRHYALSRHGWAPETIYVKADPQSVSIVREYSRRASSFTFPEPWSPPADWVSSPSMSPH